MRVPVERLPVLLWKPEKSDRYLETPDWINPGSSVTSAMPGSPSLQIKGNPIARSADQIIFTQYKTNNENHDFFFRR
jgi:hypothetical protein